MKRAAFSLSLALLLGVWAMNAQAVCFKDVSPSIRRHGPVVSVEHGVSDRDSGCGRDGPFGREFLSQGGGFPARFYKLKLEGRLKGNVGETLEVFSPNDSGRLPLAKGTRYLLFLRKDGGYLTADACGNSAKLVSPFR